MTLNQTRIISFCLLLLLVAAGTSSLVDAPGHRVQSHMVQPKDAAQTVSLLPDSVEAIVMFSGESDPFHTPAGQAFLKLLEDAGITEQMHPAWKELAAALELTPDEAFEALLGKRVLFVAQGLENAQDRQWALVSEIGPKTEHRLRKRLKPAPRGNRAGLPIFGLEDGRFKLTTGCVLGPHNHSKNCKKHRAEHGATLLLAPETHADLFNSLLPLVAGKRIAGSLKDSQAAGQIAQLGQGDAFVLLRLGVNHQEPGQEPPFIAAVTKFKDQVITAKIAASASLFWSDSNIRAKPPTTTNLAFESLSDGALAAVIQVVDNERDPEDLQPMFALPKLLALPGQDRPLGSRIAIAVHEQGPAADGRPRIAFTLAAETDDVDETAVAGDRFLSQVATLAAGKSNARGASKALDFGGALPQAVRTIPVSGSLKKKFQILCGGSPSLSWVYRPGPGQQQADQKTGWWTVQLRADDRQDPVEYTTRLRKIGQDLSHGWAADNAPLRVSIGTLRPARLAELFVPLAESPILLPMKWIDQISWDAAIDNDGFIDASLKIKMLPSAALQD